MTRTDHIRAGLVQLVHALELRPHLDLIGARADFDGSAHAHVRSVESLIAEFPAAPVRCDVRPPHIFRYITVDGVSYMDILGCETPRSSVGAVS